MQNHDLFAGVPECLKPYYTTPTVNAPIKLSEGQVILSGGELETEEVSGVVSLVWLPWPRLELSVGAEPCDSIADDKKWTASIPGRLRAMPVAFLSSRMSGGENAKLPESQWLIDANDELPASRLSRIHFHIANGPQYHGTAIRNEAATRFHTGRAILEAVPWRITLDQIADWDSNENSRALRASRGYAITHVGRAERIDGDLFVAADAELLLQAVGSFLSFCCGAWTNPLLLVGVEAVSNALHHAWRIGGVDPAGTHSSWFDQNSNEGFGAFRGLYSRLADELWNEPIRHALHWFIIANKPGPVSIEGCIVLQQAAFELLSWTLLVQDRKLLSENQFKNLRASDQIRSVLTECGIPLGVPAQLEKLLAVSKVESWQDGPHATTEIRNGIVHASPKKRARIRAHGSNFYTEAWILGQWYLELILLRLFDYNGRYSNRLRLPCWKGTEVEPVPWAK